MFLCLVVFFGHMLKSESTFETFDIKMDDSQLNFKEIDKSRFPLAKSPCTKTY